jgi:hypothetical protein
MSRPHFKPPFAVGCSPSSSNPAGFGSTIPSHWAFTLVWAADVIYWWSGLERYARRPVRLSWFVHAFFAFMIFQAGVVFAAGPIRWLTLAGLSIVAFLGLVRLAQPLQHESPQV